MCVYTRKRVCVRACASLLLCLSVCVILLLKHVIPGGYVSGMCMYHKHAVLLYHDETHTTFSDCCKLDVGF